MLKFVERADRVRLQIPITYRIKGDEEWLLSRVVNLSESGVLFGPAELPPGAGVEVIISAPMPFGARLAGPYLCAGRIVRRTEAGAVAACFEACRMLLDV